MIILTAQKQSSNSFLSCLSKMSDVSERL